MPSFWISKKYPISATSSIRPKTHRNWRTPLWSSGFRRRSHFPRIFISNWKSLLSKRMRFNSNQQLSNWVFFNVIHFFPGRSRDRCCRWDRIVTRKHRKILKGSYRRTTTPTNETPTISVRWPPPSRHPPIRIMTITTILAWPLMTTRLTNLLAKRKAMDQRHSVRSRVKI